MKVLTFFAGVVGFIVDAVFGEGVIVRPEPEVVLDEVDRDDLRRGYSLPSVRSVTSS
jgi:hypothetical protein